MYLVDISIQQSRAEKSIVNLTSHAGYDLLALGGVGELHVGSLQGSRSAGTVGGWHGSCYNGD